MKKQLFLICVLNLLFLGQVVGQLVPTPKLNKSKDKIRITQIQQALKERGYYNGPIDNILSQEVHTALVKFKRDKNLGVCGDDIGRILKALEIEY